MQIKARCQSFSKEMGFQVVFRKAGTGIKAGTGEEILRQLRMVELEERHSQAGL